MEIARVKNWILSADVKTKVLLFLGMTLLVATLPKGWILPLGVLLVLGILSKSLWSGFLYIFSTAFRFIVGLVLLLFVIYIIMLVVVYFFT
jgi:hypothetical protein